MAAATNNSIRRVDVERIVREVLSGMRPGSCTAPAAGGGELRLTKKVVSLADVEGRLQGVTQVVVTGGAVLTPAARDELKKYAVSVASAVPAVAAQSQMPLCACIAQTASDARPLEAVVEGEMAGLTWLRETKLPAAVDAVCGRVLDGALGVLLTGESAAALCLANRRPGVRAALGTSVAAIDAALESIAANLLVVDPAGQSAFALRQLLRAWVRGRRNVPARYGAQLD